METYRSGHNGADSKSVCAKAHVGSNPTVSAKDKRDTKVSLLFFRRRDGGFEGGGRRKRRRKTIR